LKRSVGVEVIITAVESIGREALNGNEGIHPLVNAPKCPIIIRARDVLGKTNQIRRHAAAS
jgi:hypothetical protein